MLKLIKSVIAIRPKRYLRLRIFADGIIIGLFTGIVVGLFRYLLALSEIYRPMIYEFVKNEPEMIFGKLQVEIEQKYNQETLSIV